MHHVTNDRLFYRVPDLTLIRVRKDETTMRPAQLYALEQAARRARSVEMARLLRAGARALKTGLQRVLHALKLKGLSHA
jgi:hypothetical protein